MAPVALDICYRFPAYPHRRHTGDGRANAINCAVLRIFIQRNSFNLLADIVSEMPINNNPYTFYPVLLRFIRNKF